ncbi:MAG: hypothetical protein M5U09_12205 [Gammaproteobacteria bacterium]|nr:hypothetical protein [Gammaproteobacteria bacterium]
MTDVPPRENAAAENISVESMTVVPARWRLNMEVTPGSPEAAVD